MKVSLLLLLVASVASADFVDEPIDGKDVGDVPGVEDAQDMQEAGFSQVIVKVLRIFIAKFCRPGQNGWQYATVPQFISQFLENGCSRSIIVAGSVFYNYPGPE